MNKNRPAWMVLGAIVAVIGMIVFVIGNVMAPAPIGIAGMIVGGILVVKSMTWIFWGGD